MMPGIVGESDLSGNLTAEYVFFDGKRVARKDFPGGAVSYYFSDRLKTASIITDSAGNIKSESDFYPWGGELQFVNNDSNHYKFTGKRTGFGNGPRLLRCQILFEWSGEMGFSRLEFNADPSALCGFWRSPVTQSVWFCRRQSREQG
jgi:hypothetical protein